MANIAIILGSQRNPRAGAEITDFVRAVIEQHLAASPQAGKISLETIDIASLDLPLLDEPAIPGHITDTSQYKHEHTRRWSTQIKRFQAFVFVTPEYNFGTPAGLKNALDYLMHEWRGKPAMVVSYGGRGGVNADAALRKSLEGGVRMKVVEAKVNLKFPNKDVMDRMGKGETVGLDASKDTGIWDEHKPEIAQAWDGLVALLDAAEPPQAQA